MKRVILLAAVSVLLASGSPALSQPVSIGSISPLTGSSATQGLDMKRGEELALEEINAAGGVRGKPLKIIFEDDESSPKGGVDAAHKLVEVDKVPLIVGSYASGVSLPTGQYTNAQRVVQIAVASTSPKLRDIGPYFFDVMGLDEVMGTKLARFALQETNAKKFASITVNNPFGIGIEIWTKKVVQEAGAEMVTAVRYDEQKPDYRAEVQRLFSQNPEVVFFTAYGTESKLILKQAYELGLKPSEGWYADYLTMWSNEVIPKTADGIKGLDVGVTSGARYEHYKALYKAKYNEEPLTTFGIYAYDATWLAALAINFANSPNTEDVRKALLAVSHIYKGASGDKNFDEDGMQVTETYQTLIYKNGKVQPYTR